MTHKMRLFGLVAGSDATQKTLRLNRNPPPNGRGGWISLLAVLNGQEGRIVWRTVSVRPDLGSLWEPD